MQPNNIHALTFVVLISLFPLFSCANSLTDWKFKNFWDLRYTRQVPPFFLGTSEGLTCPLPQRLTGTQRGVKFMDQRGCGRSFFWEGGPCTMGKKYQSHKNLSNLCYFHWRGILRASNRLRTLKWVVNYFFYWINKFLQKIYLSFLGTPQLSQNFGSERGDPRFSEIMLLNIQGYSKWSMSLLIL